MVVRKKLSQFILLAERVRVREKERELEKLIVDYKRKLVAYLSDRFFNCIVSSNGAKHCIKIYLIT